MLSQEIETFYLIPSIRKNLVLCMVHKNIEKKKICEYLNLTKSAVSQYISDKRSKNFNLDIDIVKKICNNILQGKSYVSEIQCLINELKESGKICEIYQLNNLVPEDCKVCKNGSIFR